MALALAERLRAHVRLDERSAGFFALGLSLATGAPTVICVTSGTAAVELHAAVVEAHQGRVPLIVCTADRPPELHHVGAPQTIDQIGLFTTSTRWSCDPGVPEASQAGSWRPLAQRAMAEARGGPLGPGPVHLNLAFREPLVGEAGPLPEPRGPVVVPLPADRGAARPGTGRPRADRCRRESLGRPGPAPGVGRAVGMARPGRSPVGLPDARDRRRRRRHRAHPAGAARDGGAARGDMALPSARRVRRRGGGPRCAGDRGRSVVAVDRPQPRGDRVPPCDRRQLDRRRPRFAPRHRSRMVRPVAVRRGDRLKRP